MADAAERSIPATPRRRAAAREQGAAPNAALPAFVALAAAAVILLPGWSNTAVPAAGAFMRESFTAARAPRGGDPLPVPWRVLGPTAALVLGAAGAGLCVRILLDGSAWRLSRAAPRWRRVDPLAGLGRILSAATLRAALWNAACLAVIAVAAACATGPIVGLLRADPATLDAGRAVAVLRGTLVPVLAAAAAVTAARWGLARLAFERRLRMTPEEFKEEMKSLEADPRVRLARRSWTAPSRPVADTRSGR
ncbi:MAG: hypothetical protein EBZ74_07425 [Planctomycetia bacterium]|nr:hypothetical protein [Planctomycetia bacterium]